MTPFDYFNARFSVSCKVKELADGTGIANGHTHDHKVTV